MYRTSLVALLLVVIAATLAACRKSAGTLEQECSRGGPASCYALGEMYLAGSGVAQDKEKAAQLFERACEGRESNGCDKARQMYEEYCEKGNAVACSYLGRMYLDGFGVTPDLAKAAGLYERACQKGLTDACQKVPKERP